MNIREVKEAQEYAEWTSKQQRKEDHRKKCEEAQEDFEKQYESCQEEHSEIFDKKQVIKPAKKEKVLSLSTTTNNFNYS